MRNYEERAKDFIKQVFPFITDFESPRVLQSNIRKYNAKYTRNVKVRNGCARVALITSDYVVKWDYDADEADSIGGCENEITLYAIAERESFAYLFAKITRYCYGGHLFYIMPRVYGINYSNGHAWDYMTVHEKEWCRNHYLTDLHCSNFGLTNGKITIVDYAYQTNIVDESYDSNESEVSSC